MKKVLVALLLASVMGCGMLPEKEDVQTPLGMVKEARILVISLDSQVGSLAELKSLTKEDAQKKHNILLKYQEELDAVGGLLRDALPSNDKEAMDRYRLVFNSLQLLRKELAEKAAKEQAK